MAVTFTKTYCNNFLYLLGKRGVDFDTDTFAAKLYGSGLVFNGATHEEEEDISTYELGTGNGYTVGGITLTGGTWVKGNPSYTTFDEIQWIAAPGSLVFKNCVIIDTTVNLIVLAYVASAVATLTVGQEYRFTPAINLGGS